MNNIGLDRVRDDLNYNLKNTLSDITAGETDNISIYSHTGHTCDYIEIEDFSRNVENLDKQISFFSQNVCSLPGEWGAFSDQIQLLNKNKFKFTVIAISELWNVPPDVQYQLPGYSSLHFTIRDKSGLKSNAGGGVGLWVDSRYSFEPIAKLSIFKPNVFESQFIKLKTSKNKFSIIGNVYRPNTAPLASIKSFIDILENIFQSNRSDQILEIVSQ